MAGSAPSALQLYNKLPVTGFEVIFNEMKMAPAPTTLHQILLSDLHVLLYNFLKNANSGIVIPSPVDVYLESDESGIQPDLLVMLNKHKYRIKTEGIYGPPDLIIEILSGDKTYDTQRKRSLYEKAGVREYFMIDPENKTTTLLTLNHSGIYEQTYEEKGLLRSAILNCNIGF